MMNILYVALGGALGACGRYAVGLLSARLFPETAFPVGTFIANATGGLLMGLVMGWLSYRLIGAEPLRLFLAVGVLGGFTTFSSFSLEALTLIKADRWALAGSYITASVIVSIAAVFLGLVIARKLFAV